MQPISKAMTAVQRQPLTSDAGSGQTLASVLHQSAQIEAKVEKCAEEMSVINALLEGELPSLRRSRNAERAVDQSKRVKEWIGACAEELHRVNTALALEINERKRCEYALASAQARSIGVQIDLLEAQAELARVKEGRERDRYFAFHDPLTGLPNPNLFYDRLEGALAYAKRYKHALAVMCIDLNHFKRINDAHTHYIGDKVLQIVAQRLRASVRATDTVSRQEGDHFLFLLAELMHHRAATAMARNLINAIAQPCEVEELTLAVTASIGIAVYPRDGETAEALIENAGTARRVAKRSDDGYTIFNARHG
jgi:diguanylate cyclase (GGDEF)-like protein